MLRLINPAVVRIPDGRTGVLVARLGMHGCVEFGKQRIVESHRLEILGYHITVPGNRECRIV